MKQPNADEPSSDPVPSEQEVLFTVAASESARTGVYADVASVSSDPDGITVDFFFTEPADRTQGVLQARVHMSHRMGLRLFQALRNNFRTWAGNELGLREKEQELLEALTRIETKK